MRCLIVCFFDALSVRACDLEIEKDPVCTILRGKKHGGNTVDTINAFNVVSERPVRFNVGLME